MGATTISTPVTSPAARSSSSRPARGGSCNATRRTRPPRWRPICPTATSAAAATTIGRCRSSRCTPWTPRAGDLRPISAFENFEWTPAVADDGRILYTPLGLHRPLQRALLQPLVHESRRQQRRNWSTATTPLRPQVIHEARPIPNSQKLVFTASAHHSILGGSLVLLDRTPRHGGGLADRAAHAGGALPRDRGHHRLLLCQSLPALRRALPGGLGRSTRCRRTAGWTDADRNPVNAMGLYLYDAYGNLNLLYRDPAISSGNPIPVRARPKPAAYADSLARRRARGRLLPGPGRLSGTGPDPAGKRQIAARRGGAAQGPAAQGPAQPGRLAPKIPASICWAPCPSSPTARPISACPAACRSSSRPSTPRDWPCRPCAA